MYKLDTKREKYNRKGISVCCAKCKNPCPQGLKASSLIVYRRSLMDGFVNCRNYVSPRACQCCQYRLKCITREIQAGH